MKRLIWKDICAPLLIIALSESQDMETTQVSTNGLVKMCCVCETHTHNGILPAIKRWNLAICDDMDGPWGFYAKWASHMKKDKHCKISFIHGILKNKINEETRQKQTHRYREQSSSYLKKRDKRKAKWVNRINCMVTD